MEKERNLLLAKYLRGIARYTLLVVLILVFISRFYPVRAITEVV